MPYPTTAGRVLETVNPMPPLVVAGLLLAHLGGTAPCPAKACAAFGLIRYTAPFRGRRSGVTV